MTVLANHAAISDPAEIFKHLPANRVGDADRRYMAEVLDDFLRDANRIQPASSGAQANRQGGGRSNTAEFMEYTKRFAPEIEVVVESWPKIFQPDYTENITALLNNAPQALYSCLWGGDLVAFFDQASLYGLFDQFQTVAVNLGDYPVLEAIKQLPAGIHSGSRYNSGIPDTEANAAWNETYRANSPVLPTNWAWQTYSGVKFMVEAMKATGGDTDARKLAEATRGMTIDSPFGVDGTLTLRADDHTLIDYPVGYGLTLPNPPYVEDFQMTAWDEILKYEAEWKERNGYT